MSMLANDPDSLLVLNSGAHAQDMSVHFRSPIVRSCNWCNCYNWLWIFLSVGPIPNHHILLDSIYLDFKIFEDSEAPRLVSQIDCRLWLRFKDCGNPICLNSAILCLQLPASEVWELCADRGRRRLFQLKLGIQRYSHVIFEPAGSIAPMDAYEETPGPDPHLFEQHDATAWRKWLELKVKKSHHDHELDGTHQKWSLLWSEVIGSWPMDRRNSSGLTSGLIPGWTDPLQLFGGAKPNFSHQSGSSGAETLTLKTP